MSAHTCTTYDPSCYRCDLSRDEVMIIARENAARWAGTLRILGDGVTR